MFTFLKLKNKKVFRYWCQEVNAFMRKTARLNALKTTLSLLVTSSGHVNNALTLRSNGGSSTKRSQRRQTFLGWMGTQSVTDTTEKCLHPDSYRQSTLVSFNCDHHLSL